MIFFFFTFLPFPNFSFVSSLHVTVKMLNASAWTRWELPFPVFLWLSSGTPHAPGSWPKRRSKESPALTSRMQPWQLSLPKHNAWLRLWAVPTYTASGFMNYTNLQGVPTDTRGWAETQEQGPRQRTSPLMLITI